MPKKIFEECENLKWLSTKTSLLDDVVEFIENKTVDSTRNPFIGKIKILKNKMVEFVKKYEKLEFRSVDEIQYDDKDFKDMYDNPMQPRDKDKLKAVYTKVCKGFVEVIGNLCTKNENFFKIIRYYAKVEKNTSVQKAFDDFEKNTSEIYKKAKDLSSELTFDSSQFKEFNKILKLVDKNITSEGLHNDVGSEAAFKLLRAVMTNSTLNIYNNYHFNILLEVLGFTMLEISYYGLYFIVWYVTGRGEIKKALPLLENVYEINDDRFTSANKPNDKNFKNETIPFGEKDLYGDSGKPKASDVKQGNLADCFLEAVLQTLAKKNPNVIKDCIKIINKNNEKYVEFSVFPVKTVGNRFVADGSRKTITFLATVLDSGNQTIDKTDPWNTDTKVPRWPGVCEKGVALGKKAGLFVDQQLNHLLEPFIHDGNVYKRLNDGGISSIYFTALTGKSYELLKPEDAAFKAIIASKHTPKGVLNGNMTTGFNRTFWVPAVFGFPKKNGDPNIMTPKKNNSKIMLCGEHEYSIMGNCVQYMKKHMAQLTSKASNWREGCSSEYNDIILLRNPHSANNVTYTFRTDMGTDINIEEDDNERSYGCQ